MRFHVQVAKTVASCESFLHVSCRTHCQTGNTSIPVSSSIAENYRKRPTPCIPWEWGPEESGVDKWWRRDRGTVRCLFDLIPLFVGPANAIWDRTSTPPPAVQAVLVTLHPGDAEA